MNSQKIDEKIKVLETGNGWIGIEKPCGISVHNDPGKDALSIVNSMILHGQIDLENLVAGEKISTQPVHRLDKDTSGVLLLAYTSEALIELSKCFQEGSVHKKYFALVHGNFDETDHCNGAWDFPLSKDAGGRNNPGGAGKKVRAKTCFKVLRQSPHYALLEITLITGRTHQIRRHAKLGGHPVTSDKRYGSKKSIEFLKHQCGYERLGLHAQSIEIPDKSVIITSKGVPREMAALLDQDQET